MSLLCPAVTQKPSERDQQAGCRTGCSTRIRMNGLDLEVGQVKLLACPISQCECLNSLSLSFISEVVGPLKSLWCVPEKITKQRAIDITEDEKDTGRICKKRLVFLPYDFKIP